LTRNAFAQRTGRRRWSLEGLPDPLASIGLETTQLAIAANAVDVAVLEKRSAYDGVEVCGVIFAGLFCAPDLSGARLAESSRSIIAPLKKLVTKSRSPLFRGVATLSPEFAWKGTDQ